MEAHDSRFEEAWREAFEEASSAPPAEVWNGIEDVLDGKKTKKSISRRLWLLKLAMAASVLYGMSTTGLNLHETGFTFDHWNGGEETIVMRTEQPLNVLPVPHVHKGSLHYSHEPAAREPQKLSAVAGSPMGNFVSFNPAEIRGIPMLPYYAKEKNGTFTSIVNFSGGAGSSGNSSVWSLANTQFMEGNMVQAVSEASSVSLDGPIFNLGIGFKARVKENWVILTGLNYQERRGSGQSNFVAQTTNGGAVWAGQGVKPEHLTEVSPYAVDHRLQYVSVPVQMGYVLMDDKVDVAVYGGISNDILVGHKVSDPEGRLSNANLTDSSTFRRYGVSGIVSAEVSYDINDNYSVGVYPQVRKALTSLSKETDTRPLALEMGVRLSYNIN